MKPRLHCVSSKSTCTIHGGCRIYSLLQVDDTILSLRPDLLLLTEETHEIEAVDAEECLEVNNKPPFFLSPFVAMVQTIPTIPKSEASDWVYTSFLVWFTTWHPRGPRPHCDLIQSDLSPSQTGSDRLEIWSFLEAVVQPTWENGRLTR